MSGRIFVSRRIPEVALELLRKGGVEVVVGQTDDWKTISRRRLEAGVRTADVLLCQLTETVDRRLLSLSARLRGVAVMAVGYDNVDVEAATELGIPVANTPGVLTETTADFTWALLLAVARRLPEAHAYTVSGQFRTWGPNLFLGADVGPGGDQRRKTLGLVGYGRIGAAVARRAAGFDIDVIAHDPRHREQIEASPIARWSEIHHLFAASDFVSLHCPLTAETRHLVGAAELAAMKATALLVNTARGPVVDEQALVTALRDGQIAGAALDVYEREPTLAAGLAELSNVVLAPHIASASGATRGRMATMVATNALHQLDGEPAPNVVNSPVYGSDAFRRRLSSSRSSAAPPASPPRG